MNQLIISEYSQLQPNPDPPLHQGFQPTFKPSPEIQSKSSSKYQPVADHAALEAAAHWGVFNDYLDILPIYYQPPIFIDKRGHFNQPGRLKASLAKNMGYVTSISCMKKPKIFYKTAT